MNDEIIKTFYNANLEKRVLSKDDIYDIIDFLIIENSLKKYCKDIDLNSYDIEALEYDSLSRKIEMNYEMLIFAFKNYADKITKDFKLNDDEKIKIINNYIMLGILHSLNYVKQRKIIKEEDSDLSYLLKIDGYLLLSKGNRYYNRKYDYFYSTYHAEINAYYDLINYILNNKYKDSPLIPYIFNGKLASLLMKKYHLKNNKVITPIETFNTKCLKLFEPLNHEFFKQINQREGNNYDILLGRTISEDEFKYIEDISRKFVKTTNLFKDIR